MTWYSARSCRRTCYLILIDIQGFWMMWNKMEKQIEVWSRQIEIVNETVELVAKKNYAHKSNTSKVIRIELRKVGNFPGEATTTYYICGKWRSGMELFCVTSVWVPGFVSNISNHKFDNLKDLIQFNQPINYVDWTTQHENPLQIQFVSESFLVSSYSIYSVASSSSSSLCLLPLCGCQRVAALNAVTTKAMCMLKHIHSVSRLIIIIIILKMYKIIYS